MDDKHFTQEAGCVPPNPGHASHEADTPTVALQAPEEELVAQPLAAGFEEGMELAANRPLILVIHASVGSGHRSAANAIAEAFRVMQAEACAPDAPSLTGDPKADEILRTGEVRVLDILDHGRHVFDGNRTATMFTGWTRPFYDITWRFTFTGRLLWGGGTIWSHLMYSPFTQYIREQRPVAVVATHITAANAAVAARMLTGQTFPIVCVPTDYETEGLWPHASTDLFCVASESMAETLRPRKVPESRILITGIPTREDFRRDFDHEVIRRELGLPADKRVVLVLAGAFLPQPYILFRSTMDEVLPYLHSLEDDMHFVFVAGRDEEYATHLRTYAAELGLENVTVMDYVEDMASLMAASDLVICKSGGLTVTECLCAQTPMILLGRAYGQEKVNVNMLTSQGAAMHATTARELLNALRQIAATPQSVEAMVIHGRFIRRPDAARAIVRATLLLAAHPKAADDPLFKKHFLHFYWGGKPAHIR